MKINLNKNDKYILACSTGPDSMALFDLLLSNSYVFAVCFCNFHLRKESEKEEEKIKYICKKENIPLFILEVYKNNNENEEARARRVRYEFFFKTAKENGYKNILIAHNKDDLIETYLLQKERNSIVSYYGLNEEFEVDGLKIIRPILNYYKSEILLYCDEKHIDFSIDLSNFNNKYKRNNVRNTYLNKLSSYEKDKICETIKLENEKLGKIKTKVKGLIDKIVIYFEELINLTGEEFQSLVIKKIEKFKFHYDFSANFSEELFNKIKKDKSFVYEIEDKIKIIYSYKEFAIISKNPIKYRFFLNDLNEETIFKINKNSSYFDMLIDKAYEIKPVNAIEKFKLNGVEKKINRLFIDTKTPLFLRYIWPGVYDKEGNLIYTPHYKKNIEKKENSFILFNEEEILENFCEIL